MRTKPTMQAMAGMTTDAIPKPSTKFDTFIILLDVLKLQIFFTPFYFMFLYSIYKRL
jgi:hypothetical protein